MYVIRNLFISLGYFFAILFVGTLLVTIFDYFSLLSIGIINILKLIIPIIGIFISSYRLASRSKKNGYLEGIKMGIIVIFIFVVMILLLDKFSFRSVIYYVILLITSILSGMLGINRKKI